MKPPSLRTTVIALVTLTLTCIVPLSACGGTGGAATGALPAEEKSLEPLSESELQEWLSGSTAYAGREATVTGKVFSIDRKDGRLSYLIYTKPETFEGPSTVYYEGGDPGIGVDAYLKATGTVAEPGPDESVLDGTLIAAQLNATEVKEISYIEAVAPTTAEVTPDAYDEFNGYRITVDKVEFSKKETRVYVTVTNDGAGRLSVYDYNTLILQDGKQFNVERKYDAGYPELNKEIAMGASVDAILPFPVIEQKDFQIQIQGFSDNYLADGGSIDFTIDIPIEEPQTQKA